MSEVYTHKFKFAPGVGRFIEGDIEFNSDGKCSFAIKKSSDPIAQSDLIYFNKFIELIMEFGKKDPLDELSIHKKIEE